MLDQETKRKIDNARDILVGKVPDPKSQVEQITIALIYKFMDDMDKESEEWGGEATFFTGEYEKYAWSKIFDPRLGGFDLITLYGEAIVKMNQNPNIPQLFRDIFKNAYLPYRDPETLKSFLKEINEFTYDHSERLGDAFEYLLSAMDSQGEAGQFRTPRHIIDFIVEIVDPKKNETVLDPACGTAGFLISSYKHILRANTKDRTGDKLTPDEKKRLMNNFTGYDISPDMVRLSLVNSYLHSFSDPKIHEYDTLTSEERWDETADVMLANPPFMTPKGGIRPHKRFSIQAKRSEVLFVDYIAEHLNPNGRAGVIVPEGIIFQSQTAYKNLRKMLVEDYLWAVVSLPAGIFQPYSGVKTSILLIDKNLAKKTNKILFVKIENDGFDLGAQRRPIDKNDLPEASDFMKLCQKAIMDHREVEETDFVHVVKKAKVAESGDWNLSGDRYRDLILTQDSAYEFFRLRDLVELKKDKSPIGNHPYIEIGDVDLVTKGYSYKTKKSVAGALIAKKNNIVISRVRPTRGAISLIKEDEISVSGAFSILEVNEKLIPKYLFYILYKDKSFFNFLGDNSKGASYPTCSNSVVLNYKIPLPPLDVQKAIVAEIDGYQKIIDGARQVVNNYKPTIKIDLDWELMPLGEVCEKITDGTHDTPKPVKEGIPFITAKHVKEDIDFDNCFYLPKEIHQKIYARCNPEFGDVLVVNIGVGCGLSSIVNVDFEFSMKNVALLKTSERLNSKFINYYLQKQRETIYNMVTQGGAQAFLSLKTLRNLKVPLPPLSVQLEIVAQIEAEQEIVNANKKLITIYEQKIKDKIKEVWGDKS